MAKKKTCSLCENEIQFTYSLQKYGVDGHLCGSCYDKKLKEIYKIDH